MKNKIRDWLMRDWLLVQLESLGSIKLLNTTVFSLCAVIISELVMDSVSRYAHISIFVHGLRNFFDVMCVFLSGLCYGLVRNALVAKSQVDSIPTTLLEEWRAIDPSFMNMFMSCYKNSPTWSSLKTFLREQHDVNTYILSNSTDVWLFYAYDRKSAQESIVAASVSYMTAEHMGLKTVLEKIVLFKRPFSSTGTVIPKMVSRLN